MCEELIFHLTTRRKSILKHTLYDGYNRLIHKYIPYTYNCIASILKIFWIFSGPRLSCAFHKSTWIKNVSLVKTNAYEIFLWIYNIISINTQGLVDVYMRQSFWVIVDSRDDIKRTFLALLNHCHLDHWEQTSVNSMKIQNISHKRIYFKMPFAKQAVFWHHRIWYISWAMHSVVCTLLCYGYISSS